MGAALEARHGGADTILLDERAALGGQIYKRLPKGFRVSDPARLGKDYEAGHRLVNEVETSGARIHLQTSAWDVSTGSVHAYGDDGTAIAIDADAIVLAPGAYDKPVPFPGWTLPGVFTAGGAQSLIKTQRIIPGNQILMVGSGPLVLAFAAQLLKDGANIVGVVEAAPFPSVPAMLGLLRASVMSSAGARLLLTGIGYRTYLLRHGVTFRYSHVIVAAEGESGVEAVRIARVDDSWTPVPGTEQTVSVDAVCVGYGFTPSTELSRLAGCTHRYDEALGGLVPVRSASLESTIPGIYVAGDGAGVEGSAVALEEGRLAGLSALHKLSGVTPGDYVRRSKRIRGRLAGLRRFQQALGKTYRVGPGLYRLATADTVVCRCEEITALEIARAAAAAGADPHGVKSVTRAGMGLCQGRNCSEAVARLVAEHASTASDARGAFKARAPARPLPIGVIAEEMPEEEPVAEVG